MGQQAAESFLLVMTPERRTAPARIDHDQALIEALRRREPASAERLVETYGDRAYRLAKRITRNAQDAEEIVQDALWTIVRKIDTFRGEAAFGSWLYRIVANAAYQRVRGLRRRRPEISLDEVLPVFHEDGEHSEAIVDWSGTIDNPARQTELRSALSAAMDALPEDHRIAIVLRDVEGFSTAAVAETLGLSVANVKTRVHRGRLFLRRRLAEYASTGGAVAVAAKSA